MIDALSPLSRRIIAVALLVLVIITTLNLAIVPLWNACAESLDELSSARSRLSRMQAIAQEPEPESGDKVPTSAIVVSPTRDGAVATLIGAISASAAKANVTPQSLNPIGEVGPSQKLAVDIVAAGSEVDLVAFLAAIESTPAIRLQTWSIVAPATPDDQGHLQARAIALWATRS